MKRQLLSTYFRWFTYFLHDQQMRPSKKVMWCSVVTVVVSSFVSDFAIQLIFNLLFPKKNNLATGNLAKNVKSVLKVSFLS